MSKFAYFLATRCRALLFDSSMLALCSHPTADVLSPSASIHDRGGVELSRRVSHVVMTAARNSSKLFLFCTEWQKASGIFHRHAFPVLTEYPPIPVGQASENSI